MQRVRFSRIGDLSSQADKINVAFPGRPKVKYLKVREGYYNYNDFSYSYDFRLGRQRTKFVEVEYDAVAFARRQDTFPLGQNFD